MSEDRTDASAGTPWFHGRADQELIGLLETRGWDKKDAPTAAIEAARAYRELERYRGAPAERLIMLPKDGANDLEGMKAVWQKLGAPDKPEGYDFTALGNADPKFVDHMRATASELNLPKDVAVKVADAVLKHQAEAGKETTAAREFKAKEELAALDKNWGSNKAQFMFQAQKAAERFGLTPEVLASMEQVTGYSKIMEFLRDVGTRMGEDKWVSGSPSATGPRSVAQASKELADLKLDPVWRAAYLAGGRKEMMLYQELTRDIVSPS